MTAEPSRDSISERVYALIFNGITRAGSAPADADFWLPLSARERLAEAAYAELRAGNIEFRLGPLALLAQAAETEASRNPAHTPFCDGTCSKDPMANCPDRPGRLASETETTP